MWPYQHSIPRPRECLRDLLLPNECFQNLLMLSGYWTHSWCLGGCFCRGKMQIFPSNCLVIKRISIYSILCRTYEVQIANQMPPRNILRCKRLTLPLLSFPGMLLFPGKFWPVFNKECIWKKTGRFSQLCRWWWLVAQCPTASWLSSSGSLIWMYLTLFSWEAIYVRSSYHHKAKIVQ